MNLVSGESSYVLILLGVVDCYFVVYHGLDLLMLICMIAIKNVVLISITYQVSDGRINNVLKYLLLRLDLNKLVLISLLNGFFLFKLRLLLSW